MRAEPSWMGYTVILGVGSLLKKTFVTNSCSALCYHLTNYHKMTQQEGRWQIRGTLILSAPAPRTVRSRFRLFINYTGCMTVTAAQNRLRERLFQSAQWLQISRLQTAAMDSRRSGKIHLWNTKAGNYKEREAMTSLVQIKITTISGKSLWLPHQSAPLKHWK